MRSYSALELSGLPPNTSRPLPRRRYHLLRESYSRRRARELLGHILSLRYYLVAKAFEKSYRPQAERGILPHELIREAIVRQFNRFYYHSPDIPWRNTYYRGIPVAKAPTDLWLYQELIMEIRPRWIVETGTQYGGSAHYFADLCELVGNGQVVSIDIAAKPGLPNHPRITSLAGSSTDATIIDKVRLLIDSGPVMVILDSDHSYGHVYAELEAYSSFVTVDSYLVVEDTNVNGHPVLPTYGRGPMEAVADFLGRSSDFCVDREREKFLLTFNPGGYLRRIQ